jgi:acyl carrier protein
MDDAEAATLARCALVDALVLDVPPESLSGEQPLYEHPVSMDSLGFHRLMVELEVKRGALFEEEALESTLFETVDDLTRFLIEQAVAR